MIIIAIFNLLVIVCFNISNGYTASKKREDLSNNVSKRQ